MGSTASTLSGRRILNCKRSTECKPPTRHQNENLLTKLKKHPTIKKKLNLQSPTIKSSSPMITIVFVMTARKAATTKRTKSNIRKEDACCCDKAASKISK